MATANLAIGAILRARHPVPGAFYNVDGRPMHLYCTGQGAPTVILESGGGDDWIYWQKVQPDLSRTTRVCSYDRAGLGWSAHQPGPRDATNIARQLHTLLQQAGESNALVMVGASAGGFYIREFVSLHPAQAAGVVFVDSSVPDQFTAIPGSGDREAVLARRFHEALIEWLQNASGWARLTGRCAGDLERGLEAYADYARANACRSYPTSALGEWNSFWDAGAQAARAHCCGTLPVLVISQDPDRPKPGWTADAIAVQPIWNALQEQLKKLSPNSRRVIARDSAHHVTIDRPDVVVAGIRGIVQQIRTGVADSLIGSTVKQ